MKNMTIDAIAKACNGKLVNCELVLNTEIKGAVLDSRLVEEGYLFFATKGERVDGHNFMADVFSKGAACCVCERVPEDITGPCIVVEDSFIALKEIAAYYRSQLDVKVVGITGSVGKTTTKEFIASVLSQKYSVLKTEKNFNNEVGLPLTILKIRDEHDIAVVEMGISDFGEMSRLTNIAKPDVAVITNIGQCHLEKLIDRDGVLKAKTEIFEGLSEDGNVVLFGDDDKLATVTEVKGKKPAYYGLNEGADVTAESIINRGLWGSEVTIKAGEDSIPVSIPLPGKHMIYNALAATAVGKLLDLSNDEIKAGIEQIESMGGRSNIIEANNIVIIDDCYNANPVSVKAAVDLLKEAVTPKVAILGDMFELGENEAMLHREVGIYAGSSGVDTVVFIGALSKHAYAGANSVITDEVDTKAFYYTTVEEALENIGEFIKKDDAVLIKASHGMHFEQIVEYLKSEECKERFDVREEKLFKKTEEAHFDDGVTRLDPMDDPSKYVAPKREGADAWVKPITEMNGSKDKKSKKVDEEQRSAWKMVMYIAIAVVALILIGLIAFGVTKQNKYNEATGGALAIVDDGKLMGKAGLGMSVYSEDGAAIVFDEYSNRSVQSDGKSIFYTLNPQGDYIYSQSFDLYRCTNKGKKNKLVADNVTAFKAIGKNRVLYIQYGNLYVADAAKGDTALLASNVAEFFVSGDKKEVCVHDYSGKLMTVVIDEPEKLEVLDEGIGKVLGVNDKLNIACFEKAGTLYVVKNKKDPVALSEGSYDEAWIADKDEKFKVYFKQGTDLYYYEAGDRKSKLVASNVGTLIGDHDKDGYLALLNDGTNTLYGIYEGESVACKDFEYGTINYKVSMDSAGKLLYFVNTESKTGISNLMSLEFNMLMKGKVTQIDNLVTDIIYIDKNTKVVCKDSGNGLRDLYYNGNLVAKGVMPESIKKTEYGKAFVFAYTEKDERGEYHLGLLNKGEVSEIGYAADFDFDALSAKKVYYKSAGSEGFDVYYFNGKKSKVKVENVDDFKYVVK